MEAIQLKDLPTIRGAFTDEGIDDLWKAVTPPEDFVLPCADLKVTPKGTLVLPKAGELRFSEPGIEDFSALLGVPGGYMKKCSPDLVAKNFNAWLKDEVNQDRELRIRVKDDSVYGVGSSLYIPVNNEDFVKAIFEKMPMTEFAGANWVVTPKTIRMNLLSEKIKEEIHVGDMVQGGFRLVNSENGFASLQYSLYFLRLVCTNGATAPVSFGGEAWKHLGNDKEKLFTEYVESLQGGIDRAGDFLKKLGVLSDYKVDPQEILKKLTETDRKLPKKSLESLVQALKDDELHTGEGTLWEVYNAITRVGRDAKKAETQELFEDVAGRIAANPRAYLLN
jgi:hypothetical protein